MDESAEWAARVETLLELGDHGIIVLVDNADDSHLGTLVRRLWARWPELRYVLNAEELRECPVGATVLLDLALLDFVVSSDDATWAAAIERAKPAALNLVRPLLRDRALRVVLWARRHHVAALAAEAPDLFDWISHRVECPPPRAPRFWVEGFLAAERAGRPILWRGRARELRTAIAGTWPEHPRWVSLSAKDYDQLVDGLAAGRDEFVIVHAASVDEVRHARWALAEARRHVRVAVNYAEWEHVEALSGFWRPGPGAGSPFPTQETHERILLGALELEWEALGLARRLPAPEIEMALKTADPGAEMARRVEVIPKSWPAIARGEASAPFLRAWGSDPRALRALAPPGENATDDLARVVIERGACEGPLTTAAEIERLLWRDDPDRYATLSKLAMSLGTYDAAARWDWLRGESPHWARLQKAAIALVQSGPAAALDALLPSDPPARDSASFMRWTAMRVRVLAEGGDIRGAIDAAARAGHSAAARASRAYAGVLAGDFRSARAELEAIDDLTPLSPVEIESVLVAAWACDDVERARALLRHIDARASEPNAALWLRWASLLEPASTAFDPERSQDACEYQRATTLFTAAERARLRAQLPDALRLASSARWTIAQAAHPAEHHLEGFAELTRGRALAGLGMRARALDALDSATSMIERTTRNARHPFALIARFERVWLLVAEHRAEVEGLDLALADLEAALWEGHRELAAARALRAQAR